jgi:aryl-alcohol dehydrogenase-like predicted oxidoreductase
MTYRKLGRTGLKVSELCLGTMQFGWTTDEKNSVAVLDAYFAAGGNFVDTADIYTMWLRPPAQIPEQRNAANLRPYDLSRARVCFVSPAAQTPDETLDPFGW